MLVSKKRIVDVAVVILLGFGGLASGQTETQPAEKTVPGPQPGENQCCGLFSPSCDYMTGDWGGARTRLEEAGFQTRLTLDTIYQNNVHGGLDTEDAQRFTGRYSLQLMFDMEKLLGLKGGTLYALGRGGFGDGLESAGKVGDYFGVNGEVYGYRSIDLLELWYQQNLLDDKLQIRIGKLDLSGTFECQGCPVSFDGNRFANDNSAQFLNNALANNPTIPFPQQGLGAIVHYNPIDWFYASIGASDAQANAHKTGFHSTFHEEAYFIYMFEFGFIPKFESSRGTMLGAYRFGLWYDPKPKECYFDNPNGNLAPRYRTDDVGFYASFDQTVYRENDQDDQGLGLFFRYGFAHGDTNYIEHFWSIGGQYTGLIPTRDKDVLGFGVAQGLLANELGYTGIEPGRETVLETYYNIEIAPWLHLSPDVQVILNPGGDHSAQDALVMGLRLKMEF